MKQHDLLIGRDRNGTYIKLPGGEPVAITARTGAGKTSDSVIPMCFTWPGSLIILDIKGSAWRTTAGHRAKEFKQDVYLFEPASRTGRSHRWDPFDAVDRESINRFEQTARMAELLFPEIHQIGNSGNNNEFWDGAGRQAFAAAAVLLAETPGQRLSLELLTSIFTRADGHEWLSELIEGRRGTTNPYSQYAVDGISDYVGTDEKLRNDIKKTVSVKAQIWRYPRIAAVASNGDFKLADLRRKPMTIYVVVQPRDIKWLRPLLRLFFDQLINLNTDVTTDDDPSLKYQTLVVLDEFIRFGRVDALAQAAQYVRDYGLRMVYCMQNKAQMREVYGPDGADDLFGNLGAEILFGTNDPKVTKEIEERLGDNTEDVTQRNKPAFWSWANWAKHSVSTGPQRRPLMYDQEVAMMDPDLQFIFRPGMPPALTYRNRWFKNADFRQMVRPPPEVPKLDVSIALDNGRVRIRPVPAPRPTIARP